MFALTVYKCGRSLFAYRLSSTRITMPITRLFLRDGVFWFLAVFGELSRRTAVLLFILLIDSGRTSPNDNLLGRKTHPD